MKGFIATILLVLMMLPFGGSYLFLEFEKSKAKNYAQLAMANEDSKVQMVWLKFTKEQIKNDLKWEHKGEFEYKGQMYDISKREEKGDTTYFYCYWDKFETLINTKLNDLIALHTTGKSSQKDAQLIVSLFKAVYLINGNDIERSLIPIINIEYIGLNQTAYQIDLTLESPPPQLKG
ncbi:MAG: hypothetical protein COW03_07065 [Cytophagales bacterium CG12_big_fil_rev_8_21_14_0_65_40_12]|nr:MAG: hypothetical protein COW03_07065 [Cytophagales bacterium CG12_big_fil_rev_8_21_14_0_65_40_12]PIW02871.1 MAG: hypothetical protein COW40_17985 [Cytophagales bacterium CG17_big_fil_post_rev_8_21_14_2_50_40_13]